MRWIYQNSYLGFYIIYHLFLSGDLPRSDTLEKPLTVKLSFLVCRFTVPDELDRESNVKLKNMLDTNIVYTIKKKPTSVRAAFRARRSYL